MIPQHVRRVFLADEPDLVALVKNLKYMVKILTR